MSASMLPLREKIVLLILWFIFCILHSQCDNFWRQALKRWSDILKGRHDEATHGARWMGNSILVIALSLGSTVQEHRDAFCGRLRECGFVD